MMDQRLKEVTSGEEPPGKFLLESFLLSVHKIEGNGYPLQYSCLGSPMHREAWWATVHGGHKESDIT